MNVCVIGSGYVGLVTGACFAEFGVNVICADKDEAKIDMLERGEIPIYEPGLEALVKRNVSQGRLAFTSDTPEAVRASLVLFIAVRRRPRTTARRTSAVEQVAREIAPDGRLQGGRHQSTVPSGTSLRRELVDGAAAAGKRAGSASPRTRSSCARARRSRTSCAPIGS
jgi:UDPglucose 6-dehydrogenase